MTVYNVQNTPKLAQIHFTTKSLRFTRHALTRAADKGVEFDSLLAIKAGEVVELEMKEKTLTKVVVRQAQCSEWDRVLVVVPSGNDWLLITCWLNHKSDNHKTLDQSRLAG